MEKIWNIMNDRKEESSVIESILVSKGIKDPKEIEEFLSEKPQKTYDPLLIKNMSTAVAKVKEHVLKNNRIVIFGDYDVDGVSATSLLVEFFINITDNIEYYIPNRFSEGYGLNKEAIRFIKEEMAGDIIITVDNGISSLEEVEYAKEIGLDIIVTDHHNPPEIIPQCCVINVKQDDDHYPFKELCGCGVAFKFIQALQREFNLPKATLNSALDLVALATISDLVPLLDENRTFVKYGLKLINSNKRIGFMALREKTGLKDRVVNAGKIGYNLGPCFNAAGRIEDAKLGVRLLLEKNIDRARELAEKLHTLNLQRQNIQQKGEELCIKKVQEKYINDEFLVIEVNNISEGVIGIIASKVKDYFYKPTLIVTEGEDGYLKGSGRSINGIDIFQEMNQVSDLFLGFGGHEMACGFSIEKENVDELRRRLNKRGKEIKDRDPSIYIPRIDIITEIEAKELNIDLIQKISKLEPYGVGNPKPLFVIKNIQVNNSWTKACGNDKTHLKFSGRKEESYISGIGFNLADKYYGLKTPSKVDVAFRPEINEYNGKISPQMIIEDIKGA